MGEYFSYIFLVLKICF